MGIYMSSKNSARNSDSNNTTGCMDKQEEDLCAYYAESALSDM
jgi:hypothetical protein